MESVLFNKIDELLSRKQSTVIAIDGHSGAGKSTLAKKIKSHYCNNRDNNCNIISMDDFFLRPHQRTPERYAEPGGNIDYERFAEEVMTPLLADDGNFSKPFTYRIYDCKSGGFGGEITVNPAKLTLIEGVYSMHPCFMEEFGIYDFTVFIDISEKMQRERLMTRNPILFDRFINEWLPMENKYFKAFGIAEKCDFVVHTD